MISSVESLAQAQELFQVIQDPVALAVYFPFAMMFVYGMATGQFEDDNFWIMVLVYLISSVLALLFFPRFLMILG